MNIHSNKWYGCRRDLRDARDHMFPMSLGRFPASVDLRAHCPPVMDQGDLGSCTAHGVIGVLRHALLARGQPDVNLSRLALYYDERAMEGSIASDAGAEIRDGIKSAAKIGVGHENLWPYDIAKFASQPPAKYYADAVHFKALQYQRVLVSAGALKQALAQGFPVVIGVSLYESFEGDALATTGIMPMPNLKTEQIIGGHCMYVVGYGQHHGYFTVRNSWNTDWGDKGDFYCPEAYLGSTLYGSDYWIIKTEGAA